jgi:hypothetical protein
VVCVGNPVRPGAASATTACSSSESAVSPAPISASASAIGSAPLAYAARVPPAVAHLQRDVLLRGDGRDELGAGRGSPSGSRDAGERGPASRTGAEKGPPQIGAPAAAFPTTHRAAPRAGRGRAESTPRGRARERPLAAGHVGSGSGSRPRRHAAVYVRISASTPNARAGRTRGGRSPTRRRRGGRRTRRGRAGGGSRACGRARELGQSVAVALRLDRRELARTTSESGTFEPQHPSLVLDPERARSPRFRGGDDAVAREDQRQPVLRAERPARAGRPAAGPRARRARP